MWKGYERTGMGIKRDIERLLATSADHALPGGPRAAGKER
jgi:hypothetical protein